MSSFLSKARGLFKVNHVHLALPALPSPWQDYPFQPVVRPLETSAGGKRLISQFEARHNDFRAIIELIETNDSSLSSIPVNTEDDRSPRWANEMFPMVDGAVLYSLLRKENPKLYTEIGSGNSTKFARRAIEDGRLRTKIVSIDPMPRAEIDELCDEIIRAPLEDLTDTSIFTESDYVFFDGSHRSFQNTDVTVFFTEILPLLSPGCLYGIHDILLPYDYPEDWKDRFYNEQYMLMTYLLAGASGDRVLFPTAYVCRSPEFWQSVQDLFCRWDPERTIPRTGGAFWLRRP
jgi:hypothetical protein